MHQLNSALTKFENVLAGSTLVLATVLAFVQVLMRPFGAFLFWTEEAIIYLIIFSTFIGAVACLRDREHVNVDVIATFLGARGKKVMAVIAALVTIVYLVAIGWFSWMLILEPFSRSTRTPAMHLPLWTMELAVAIGMTLMLLRAIQLLVDVIRHGAPENGVDEALEAEAANIGLDVDAIRNVGAETPGPEDTDRPDDTGTNTRGGAR